MKKLSDAAVYFYEEGESCFDCILKASEYKYGLYVPKECYMSFKGFSNGFGIGGMCSALSGAIAVLGLLFDEEDVKTLRLKFLMEFRKRYGSYNCMSVYESVSGRCELVIKTAADILEDIIRESR